MNAALDDMMKYLDRRASGYELYFYADIYELIRHNTRNRERNAPTSEVRWYVESSYVHVFVCDEKRYVDITGLPDGMREPLRTALARRLQKRNALKKARGVLLAHKLDAAMDAYQGARKQALLELGISEIGVSCLLTC